MKRIEMVVIFATWVVILSGPVFAQQPGQEGSAPSIGQNDTLPPAPDEQNMNIKTYVALMRTDLRTRKKQIL